MGRKPEDISIRLERKTERSLLPNGCWLWTGSVWQVGYGAIWKDGAKAYAHRVAYELACGPIPPGMQVCHRCDVRICVRPEHFFLGTTIDNMADKVAKNRQAIGEMFSSTKLSIEDVKEIRRLYAIGSIQREIAELFDVTQSHVSRLVRRHVRANSREESQP